jgi:hypothetical protein
MCRPPGRPFAPLKNGGAKRRFRLMPPRVKNRANVLTHFTTRSVRRPQVEGRTVTVKRARVRNALGASREIAREDTATAVAATSAAGDPSMHPT